jgi:hypothetical protein
MHRPALGGLGRNTSGSSEAGFWQNLADAAALADEASKTASLEEILQLTKAAQSEINVNLDSEIFTQEEPAAPPAYFTASVNSSVSTSASEVTRIAGTWNFTSSWR